MASVRSRLPRSVRQTARSRLALALCGGSALFAISPREANAAGNSTTKKLGSKKLKRIKVEKQIGQYVFSIETGALAKQAAGAVTVQYGDTVVLVAAATDKPRPGIDFFPLTCDYRERVAAAGKFPGGFIKREGRPTTKETLTARLMDRPIRPLFPEGFNDEVQIQAFVMSSDRQTDGDVLAMNGAAAALGISELPFDGPLGSVRLGIIDGKFVPFRRKTNSKRARST
jgi:polyribonucleotide nucleotidyltransferase